MSLPMTLNGSPDDRPGRWLSKEEKAILRRARLAQMEIGEAEFLGREAMTGMKSLDDHRLAINDDPGLNVAMVGIEEITYRRITRILGGR